MSKGYTYVGGSNLSSFLSSIDEIEDHEIIRIFLKIKYYELPYVNMLNSALRNKCIQSVKLKGSSLALHKACDILHEQKNNYSDVTIQITDFYLFIDVLPKFIKLLKRATDKAKLEVPFELPTVMQRKVLVMLQSSDLKNFECDFKCNEQHIAVLMENDFSRQYTNNFLADCSKWKFYYGLCFNRSLTKLNLNIWSEGMVKVVRRISYRPPELNICLDTDSVTTNLHASVRFVRMFGKDFFNRLEPVLELKVIKSLSDWVRGHYETFCLLQNVSSVSTAVKFVPMMLHNYSRNDEYVELKSTVGLFKDWKSSNS